LAADVIEGEGDVVGKFALDAEVVLSGAAELIVLVVKVNVVAIQLPDILSVRVCYRQFRVVVERDDRVEPAVDVDLAGGVANQTVLAVGVVEERRVIEAEAAAHNRLVIDRIGETKTRTDVAQVGVDQPAIDRLETTLADGADDGAAAPARRRVRHVRVE